jgi:hypothetical protein
MEHLAEVTVVENRAGTEAKQPGGGILSSSCYSGEQVKVC